MCVCLFFFVTSRKGKKRPSAVYQVRSIFSDIVEVRVFVFVSSSPAAAAAAVSSCAYKQARSAYRQRGQYYVWRVDTEVDIGSLGCFHKTVVSTSLL